MSGQIPFHIQEEIMTQLPVKSLIRFRSVSKTWKSLIDSSEFITAHSLLSHTQPQHLLVSTFYQGGKYFSYIDDDTFPHQRSVLTPPPPHPLSTKNVIHPKVVGSSRGLVCLYGMDSNSETNMAHIWNPSIRKSVIVNVPVNPDGIGFGVCPVTHDPKIVSITQSTWYKPDIETKVMVYTLSSGEWRILSTNLPTRGIQSLYGSVFTDRFIYWAVESQTHNMILSFDVTNESFEVIDLPDSLACRDHGFLNITKRRESLAILQFNENGIYTVWMMEHGVKRSFTKLFIIKPPHYCIGAFTKNGLPIMQVDNDDNTVKLVVYKPTADHNNILKISPYIYYVKSYMETLLLLGRSDCIS